jgi:hypothetical protein
VALWDEGVPLPNNSLPLADDEDGRACVTVLAGCGKTGQIGRILADAA